ncbi:aspartate aminotransferase family protein [Halorarius litoreus]|uniref:aspartate aminotransferase family protein n=1 Tax=Halorarius litoreus TaxID=2962676 RepID=UPI0020CF28A8|nr:aspartate aminotransferase family protein [Halorarius litoreus]
MSNQQPHAESAALIERAKRVTPGGINSTSRTQMMEDRQGNPVCFEEASGAELVDRSGNRYVDYNNGWGPIILGHCDPDVNEAVAQATAKRDIVGMSTSELEVRAAELVAERVPSADKVQFGTTGSEVVAHAIRTARAVTGREKIIKFQGNYHGWYDPVALNYISEPENLGQHDLITTGMLPEATEETIVLPYNDLAAVEAAFEEHGDDIAGVILEPVAHDMGCVPPVDGYLQGLRDVTDDHGALLIFDEIITGFRHGMGGVQEREGVEPDLTTMAKAVANGYPVSLLCGKDEYMRQFGPGARGGSVYFAGTYNAHTGGMAAVVETITQLEERNVHERFEEVRTTLTDAIRDHLADAGVEGFVQEYGGVFATYFGEGPVTKYRDLLDLDDEKFTEYRWEMIDRGILMVSKFPRANLLNASLTDEQVQETIDAAGEAIRAVSE